MDRLLIRLPNWLGDALMARPLLAALRARFPSATRIAVGPAALVELLGAEDAALDRREWPATAAGRSDLAAGLRRARADAAVILPASFSSAWFAYRSGARERVGYAAEGRSPLLTRALRRPPRGDLHLSEEYLALGGTIGASAVAHAPLAVPGAWHERAAGRLATEGVPEGPLAMLAPGAAYGPAKRWPAERWARLGEALAARGFAVVLAGAAADAEACRDVAAAMTAPVRSLCGRTSLPELAALCERARLVVSNDSGLAHLAGAVGSPTLVIFGSTSSAWTAPLGARVRVVQRAPVCSPCFRRTCAIGYRCLAAVTAGEVERLAAEIAA